MENDFQDWEVLPDYNSDAVDTHEEIHAGGTLQPNYFSLDAEKPSSLLSLEDSKSVSSENPSWIEPGSEDPPNLYLNKDPGEFWSDSGSDVSDGFKASDSVRNDESSVRKQVGFSEFEGIAAEEFCSDSSQLKDGIEIVNRNPDLETEGNTIGDEGGMIERVNGNGTGGNVEKRSVVWWKMPIEFLKYCVFRMSPAWTLSVAAAFMGFMILGRRLYRMKTKSKGLQIKVALDDKASQVMSRAARLNEAFSVMKRVPVIRPSLPAAGVSTWPAMSLR